ncbi:MAG: hypothetical protein CMB80_28005 [Flammeovirgaceae bacterium]|nr:hypothetical protein [Flammeovirgaceae bacterium]|tara:strand:- start:1022 stop:1435 length:414 start_codon:yes stop_codon:yes gene_type:complete
MSCDDEYFPKGYFPYQVEYMLTGGEQQNWVATRININDEEQEFNSCSDSLWLGFEVIDDDSISSYELRKIADCSTWDTTFLGQLTASGSDAYFSDTIYLEQTNGTSNWIFVDYLTASQLDLRFVKNGTRTSYKLRVD